MIARLILLTLALCIADAAPKSTPGQINGRVVDPMGAAVPFAKVFVHRTSPNDDDNVQFVAHTDSRGEFTISLPAGGYDVLVTASSFAAAVNTLPVNGGKTTKVQWKLKFLDCSFPGMNCDTFP